MSIHTSNNLSFTILQDNRRIEIGAFVFEKTDDGFMQKNYGVTEADYQVIGGARRRVWRMYNQPRHYCVDPSPELGHPLPEYCVTAWLSSRPIPEQDVEPSKMVIVFFCDHVPGMSMEGLFTTNLFSLDWNSKARTDSEIDKDQEIFNWLERD